MPEGRRGRRPKRLPKYAAGEPSAARLYRDLCSTCNHIRTCDGRGKPDSPIFFCELFEALPAAPATPAADRPKVAGRQPQSAYEGLCMNCEDRKSCTMQKPEGGVWHCEEYR
ncbi:MAG TPA: hypothetical protein VM098_04205 [Phycisphaerae bacterium]|nr:hypothetical protein [Phycisphaerae bacterium]